jgi:Domain of unknown function (DUF4153)
MTQKTGLALGVLAAALVLGVLGDALLRATPWGVNVLLWTQALVAAAVALAVLGWRDVALKGEGGWLVFPALFFAAAFAWRDSPTLQGLNGLGLAVALALAALCSRTGKLRLASLTDYALGSMAAGVNALFGCFLLLGEDIAWKDLPRGKTCRVALGVGRGLLLALPLLLIFGGLFMAADAVFQGMVARLFDWNVDALVEHAAATAFCAWGVGGLLRQTLIGSDWLRSAGQRPASERAPALSLGTIEMGVVMGLLNALFLAFVIVQVRYLFGGAAQVATVAGLTYAEYARHGFFELVTVTALVLPVLLGLHALLRLETRAHERLFRILAGALVALLYVIMVSAIQRMRLYQSEYGMTELRLYTTAFMGWLGVLFLWFLATVLRGRRERFAFGVLVTGFLAIALLDTLNPDALIVRTNASRIQAGRVFDGSYVAGLSADAVPALVDALPSLAEAGRPAVAATLLKRWRTGESMDWRTWNWGRSRARAAVEGLEATPRETANGVGETKPLKKLAVGSGT